VRPRHVFVARLVTTFPVIFASSIVGARFDFYLHELGLSPADIRHFVLASPNPWSWTAASTLTNALPLGQRRHE
jgi:hypothetical protein